MMAGLVRGNFKNVVRRFSSALYITGDKAQNNFVVLTPYIDFEEQLKRKSDLINSIEARKLAINLDKIETRWNFFKMIEDHKAVLEFTKAEMNKLINKLKQEDPVKNGSDIEKLQSHVKLVKDDLKNVKEYSYGIEENAALAVLGLPNFLHPKTPDEGVVPVHQVLDQPQAIDKNHIQIGETENLIEYQNPTFYFLKSDASIFEFAITNYFQSKLLENGLVQFSNADFTRSVVVEGCGTDYLDKSKIFTLDAANSDLNRLHVVGGASLYSFMAYFAKHSVQSALLPLKYFSLGRKYSPVTEGSDLFNLSQNSVAQVFVACEDDPQKMDELFLSLTQAVIDLYEPLGYHFRLVYAPASDLEKGESLKLSIQMFSNYLQKYIQVGYISAYDNYLSKRLLFTYTDKKERRFPKVISGEMLNVQKFLGCALENNCKDRKPLLTELLQKYV